MKHQVKNDVPSKVNPSDDAVAEDSGTEDAEIEEAEMRNMVRSQNRKKKSGGFQSMGKTKFIVRIWLL
jgi:hypothetical protein